MYLYYSGYDPGWRQYSIMTTLMAEILRWSIAERMTTVNLSTGNDLSSCDGSLRKSFCLGARAQDGVARLYAGASLRHYRDGATRAVLDADTAREAFRNQAGDEHSTGVRFRPTFCKDCPQAATSCSYANTSDDDGGVHSALTLPSGCSRVPARQLCRCASSIFGFASGRMGRASAVWLSPAGIVIGGRWQEVIGVSFLIVVRRRAMVVEAKPLHIDVVQHKTQHAVSHTRAAGESMSDRIDFGSSPIARRRRTS